VRILAASERLKAPDPRSFDSVHQGFLDALRVTGYSAGMIKAARNYIPRFFAFLRARRIRDLRAVTEEHGFAYARHLAKIRSIKGTPYSPATQTAYLDQVRRLFAYLEKTRLILVNPTRDLVLPTWQKLPRVVPTEAQARKLVTVPNPTTVLGKRDRAVLELLYGSGIRPSEAERLDIGDLDLSQGVLYVRNGKGKKDRVVPIAGRAALAVEKYLDEARPELVVDPREQAVFLTQEGRRLTLKNIQVLVRHQVQEAGLALPLTPYSLRHGYATHLLQRGADVRHVQKLLGHSQVATTAIYTRVVPLDLKRVLEKSHPRERLYNRRRKTVAWSKEGR
jgi:integrase/recombinase XerD